MLRRFAKAGGRRREGVALRWLMAKLTRDHLLFATIAMIVGAVVWLAFAVIHWSPADCPPLGVTLAGYRAIRLGMTATDVERVLGHPPDGPATSPIFIAKRAKKTKP